MTTIQPKPKFELHGVQLEGSFGVFFDGGKWYYKDFHFEATAVSQEDLKKISEAAKTGVEVPIKFGNGQGKAKINSLHYDIGRKILTSISIELLDWGWV